jgi:hypothetical protein
MGETERRAMRVKSIVLVGVVAALVLAGCGGGSKKTSPEKYVSKVCVSVGVWQKAISSDSQKLQSLLAEASTSPDPAKLKTQMVNFVGDLVSETKQMQSELKAVGEPNVKNGAEIEKRLNAGIAKLVTALSNAKKQAEALPTNDAAGFGTGAQAVGSAIVTAGSSLGSTLSGLSSSELSSAANKDPDCQKIGT